MGIWAVIVYLVSNLNNCLPLLWHLLDSDQTVFPSIPGRYFVMQPSTSSKHKCTWKHTKNYTLFRPWNYGGFLYSPRIMPVWTELCNKCQSLMASVCPCFTAITLLFLLLFLLISTSFSIIITLHYVAHTPNLIHQAYEVIEKLAWKSLSPPSLYIPLSHTNELRIVNYKRWFLVL